MLGLAAAVFGTPFMLGALKPVAGLLAKGGLKTIGAYSGAMAAGSTRAMGITVAAGGYGLMRAARSDAVSEIYTSTYGPYADTEARLAKIRAVGTLIGGTGMVLGGVAGVFGRMPGTGLAKRGGIGAMKLAGSVGNPFAWARGAGQMLSPAKKGFARSHPFVASFAAGGALGATVAAISGSSRYKKGEGNITAMRSAPGGGISPELQFSTHGLVFAMHKSRRRSF